MKTGRYHLGAAALLISVGLSAQAQNPVANFEPTNPNNFSVNIADPANNPVAPAPGLGLDRGSTVTYLGGDPVRIVFPGKCYVVLPTFNGITPASVPGCCPGTLTQLTSLTVDETACQMAGAVPIGAPAMTGKALLGALGVAALAGGIVAIANQDDDEGPVSPFVSRLVSALEPVSPSSR